MTDNGENLILEHLRAIRNDIKSFRTQHESDMADLKHRLSSLERGMASVRRDGTALYEDQVRQQVSIDQLVERVQRIEHRLELNS